MEMAEGRFTRTTRRLMTVLQLNDRERPVAMDNIRLVAITVRRLCIYIHKCGGLAELCSHHMMMMVGILEHTI